MTMQDQKVHGYYYRLRPPDLKGTEPEDYIDRQAWTPMQEPFDTGLEDEVTPHLPQGTKYHGWVTYSQPLTQPQIKNFELVPQSAIEYFSSLIYEDVIKSGAVAIRVFKAFEIAMTEAPELLEGETDLRIRIVVFMHDKGLKVSDLAMQYAKEQGFTQ